MVTQVHLMCEKDNTHEEIDAYKYYNIYLEQWWQSNPKWIPKTGGKPKSAKNDKHQNEPLN